jgi:hypothetical protein
MKRSHTIVQRRDVVPIADCWNGSLGMFSDSMLFCVLLNSFGYRGENKEGPSAGPDGTGTSGPGLALRYSK